MPRRGGLSIEIRIRGGDGGNRGRFSDVPSRRKRSTRESRFNLIGCDRSQRVLSSSFFYFCIFYNTRLSLSVFLFYFFFSLVLSRFLLYSLFLSFSSVSRNHQPNHIFLSRYRVILLNLSQNFPNNRVVYSHSFL